MSLFEHPDYDNHEHVAFYHDPKSGLKAIIAVHNTALGPSVGGCRMFPYANSADALSDVLRLSKGMSYKAAMAGLPQGGGKAVIIGDARKPKNVEAMKEMGRFVNRLEGTYIIAEDSGISVNDVHLMGTQTPYVAGNTSKYSFDGKSADGNPAPATAYGVFCGIQAAVKFVHGDNLSGKKIAIQGVGQVGLRLAEHLHNAGAILYVSDIFEDNLRLANEQFGAHIVDNSAIHKQEVDVYSPCALGGAISQQTVQEINAKIIAGAANNQLTDDNLDEALIQKGIVYVPDYVINSGGIIDIYHQSQAHSSNAALREQLQQIGDTVLQVLENSKSHSIGTQTVANKIAEEKFKSDIPALA